MNFKQWLVEESSNPGSKTGLYPLGYGGIGNYPPSWYITRSADAIYYLTIDERIYSAKDGGDFNIKHLPGPPVQKIKSGEEGVWKISHIKGKPSHKTGKKYAAGLGEKGAWDISHIKGKPSYTKHKDFIPDQGEGGSWNIKKL